MKLELVERLNDQWAYRFTANNGEILVWSENYASKGNAKKAAIIFLDNIQDFLLKQESYVIIDKDGQKSIINEII
jgi:uncharacterized protein YegP (UPF0339 family)